MHAPIPLLTALSLAALCAAPATRAAESYDNCTGFIPTLPATISTQGTWCMDKDLSTALATGAAITVNANNVTIDCNGFKLGGLNAGLATATVGILANGRGNTTVRNCNIRGFYRGVSLSSALGGYLVEDSRFDNNTARGLYVSGEGSTIRDNQVLHTGGSTRADELFAIGIQAIGSMQILDNQVHDVAASTTALCTVVGIQLQDAAGGRVSRNVVSSVFQAAPGVAVDLWAEGGTGVTISGNALSAELASDSTAIHCQTDAHIARDNTMYGHDDVVVTCFDGGGNVDHL